MIIEYKSPVVGDPGLIGLECESGEFSNCYLNDTTERVPIGCEGALFFADVPSRCNFLCDSKRTKQKRGTNSRMKKGWTKYYINEDKPLNTNSNGEKCKGDSNCKKGEKGCCKKGTGDHEHLSFFQNRNDEHRDRLKVYDSNGDEFNNCKKIAIHVREAENHTPWWTLKDDYTMPRMPNKRPIIQYCNMSE